MKTKTLILWLFLSAAIPSFAEIFLFGDLYYCCMSDSTVAVVSDRAIPGETYNYSELTAVIIPKSVTYNDITYSVTSIGWSAFHSCIRLTSITIPNSVTSIGMLAFANCHNLTKTNYTGSIADWCRITFSDNSSNPISYSHDLFINDILIKDLVIPEEITTINDYAFYDCTSLTSVTIPNSVTSIGANAFYNVANIVYSGTATGSPWGARSVNGYVEDYLVYSDATKTTLLACSSAATRAITIPNSVTTIGKNAFHNCTGLTSITIPNSVTTIGDYAFGSVANIVYSGTATGSPWGAKSVNGYVEDYLVYSDATKTTLLACYNTVTGAITIPDGVTTIGEDAFYGCTGLTSVTIPDGVTSIGNSAFEGCIGLTSITIPNSVAYIGIYAFSGTSWYDNQPDGVVYINNILYHYKGTMPQGTSIVVKEGTICISADAFFSVGSGLTSATIPNSVTTIGAYAFYSCTSLTSVTISNSVTTIEGYAFHNTPWFDNLPDGVVYINRVLYAYKGTMPQGTNIVVKEGTTCISGCAFQGCTGLTSITIPNSVMTIDWSAFSGCTGLTSITIPNSVMTIDWSAFSGCTGLTSITIPNGVTSIGSEAFYNCIGLESVTCYADVPPTIDSKTFYKVSSNVELHVLANAVDEYKADEYWSRFTIVPIGVDNTTDGTLTVHPSQTDVTFTWPADNNADSYTLTIQKGDVVFCTLIFNDEGQLTTIAFAPARNGEKHTPNATLTTEGYKFTVMGLDEASYYTYQIVVKDREDNVLNTYQGEFRTQENIDTVVEDILTGISSTKTQKILRNGQVVILHPGKTYNTIGQEVK